MEIRTLHDSGIEQIVDAINQAFAGYYVPMPTEVSYWADRFARTGVDYGLSFGAFDGEQLVAFIIQAIGDRGGDRVAFNTGTGVLPAYRGQKWIDRIYNYAIPRLRDRDITRCQLEVIDANARAIRVYERIGFHRDRYLKCYAGELAVPDQPGLACRTTTLPELADFPGPVSRYAWDFTTETLNQQPEQYQVWKVHNGADWVGYFVLNPSNHYVMQLEALPGHGPSVLAGIRQHCASVKIINIAAERTALIDQLERAGLQNTVNQYEMSLGL